jgi:hypothetical protein
MAQDNFRMKQNGPDGNPMRRPPPPTAPRRDDASQHGAGEFGFSHMYDGRELFWSDSSEYSSSSESEHSHD